MFNYYQCRKIAQDEISRGLNDMINSKQDFK